VKNFWHGLKLKLLSGRGERSWVNGHRLLFYGVPTPAPVALLERRSGLFPTVYLLAERVQSVSAREWFHNRNISVEDKNNMADQIAGIFHIMQQQKIIHGDLKASNILIADGKPMIIDLDAMRRPKSDCRFRRAWTRDVGRFLQNWEGDVELLGLFSKALKSHGIDAIDAVSS
jgi:serine/threonine-protein kinase RIO1